MCVWALEARSLLPWVYFFQKLSGKSWFVFVTVVVLETESLTDLRLPVLWIVSLTSKPQGTTGSGSEVPSAFVVSSLSAQFVGNSSLLSGITNDC